jgi:hypothetical protein
VLAGRLGLDDGGLIKVAGGLGEDAAAERGSGHEENGLLDQEDALEVRAPAGREVPGDLPEDVLGEGPVGERDLDVRDGEDVAGDLQDEDVRVGARPCFRV